jgi:hypothetical protein
MLLFWWTAVQRSWNTYYGAQFIQNNKALANKGIPLRENFDDPSLPGTKYMNAQ